MPKHPMQELTFRSSLSLVIPCYNEAARVPLLVAGLEDFCHRWEGPLEIFLVDDGSADTTATALQAAVSTLASKLVRVEVVRQSNTGKGGALRTGVLRTTTDLVLTLDADMAAPPTELLAWFRREGGALRGGTVYIGSREHADSVIRDRGSRKLAGNIFNRVVRILTPLQVEDTQCGFKLFPGPSARALFSDLRTSGWAHDVELLWRAQNAGLAVRPMPISWSAVDGSKIHVFRDAVRMVREVLKISAILRREGAHTPAVDPTL